MNELDVEIHKMTNQYNGWGDRVGGFEKEIKEICSHYAEKLNLKPIDIFRALEKKRDYSYPNYYQWANFPKLDNIKVFKTQQELVDVIKPDKGFRCPMCSGISMNPYSCNTGLKMSNDKVCDWSASGLFRTAGKGLRIMVSENWIKNPVVEECFMPISMEN